MLYDEWVFGGRMEQKAKTSQLRQIEWVKSGDSEEWRRKGEEWNGFSKWWRKIQMGLRRSQGRKRMMARPKWRRRRNRWSLWHGMPTVFFFGSKTTGLNSPTSSPLLIPMSLPFRFLFMQPLFVFFPITSS